MNIVTLGVCSMDKTESRFGRALSSEDQGPHISFESSEALWVTFTAKRWQLLKALAGAGSMAIREAARRVGRNVKAVHRDIHALLNTGLLNKTEDGKIVFPYDAIHVDFPIKAA